MEEDKKQATEEVSAVTKQLDMWADALGLSREDLKGCKLKAIQELAEEESSATATDRPKCNGCCGAGRSCHDELSDAARDTCISANSVQYLTMMLGALSALNHPTPQINLHLHLAK